MDVSDKEMYIHLFSWYPLSSKPGRTKTGYRGEIELRLSFSVTGSVVHGSNERSSRLGSEANTDSIEPGWLDTNDDTGVVSEVEDDILDEMLDELDAILPGHSPAQQSTENILENIPDSAGDMTVTLQFAQFLSCFFIKNHEESWSSKSFHEDDQSR